MSTTAWEITSRRELRSDIEAIIKRLRQVLVSEREGESSGLLVARLGEVHERHGDVVEAARDWLTSPTTDEAALVISGVKEWFGEVEDVLAQAEVRYGVERHEIAQRISGRFNWPQRHALKCLIWDAAERCADDRSAAEEEEVE